MLCPLRYRYTEKILKLSEEKFFFFKKEINKYTYINNLEHRKTTL